MLAVQFNYRRHTQTPKHKSWRALFGYNISGSGSVRLQRAQEQKRQRACVMCAILCMVLLLYIQTDIRYVCGSPFVCMCCALCGSFSRFDWILVFLVLTSSLSSSSAVYAVCRVFKLWQLSTRWHTTQAVKLWLLCHTCVLFPIRFLFFLFRTKHFRIVGYIFAFDSKQTGVTV